MLRLLTLLFSSYMLHVIYQNYKTYLVLLIANDVIELQMMIDLKSSSELTHPSHGPQEVPPGLQTALVPQLHCDPFKTVREPTANTLHPEEMREKKVVA